MASPGEEIGVLGRPGGGRLKLALCLATVLGLAAALPAGSGSRPEPADSSRFLTQALGRPLISAPMRRTVGGRETKLERAGFTVAARGASVSIAAKDAGDREWRTFAKGVSRPTSFGRETIVVEPLKTEHFFTVEESQGLRTWQWSLRSPGLRPRLTRDGAVEFAAGNRLGGLMVLPVAIYDSAGEDVTPSGLRWSLVGGGSAWSLRLRLDDARLPVPYVIDPAITFRGAASGQNNTATTLTIPKPTGVVSGDFLIAQVTVRGGSGTTICAPSTPPCTPSEWTLLEKKDNGTTIAQAVYYKFAGASEPLSYTWTFNASQNASGGIIAYTGVNTTTPIDAFGSQTGSGSNVTAPSITTTVNDTMVVGFFGTAHFTTFTPPTGMTERYDNRSTGGMQATRTTTEGADVAQASFGPTGPKTAMAGQSALWVAHLVALKPPAAAPRTTVTTVSCMPDTVAVNQPTVCDAVVDDTDSGTGSAPSGTVTFSLVSDPPEAGAFSSPTCTLTPLDSDSSHCAVPVTYTPTVRGDGTHTIRGDYSGSLVHAASFDTFDLTVTLRSTRTTVSCMPDTVAVNQPTVCDAVVDDTDSGTGSAPSGTVTFSLVSDPPEAGAFSSPTCTLTPLDSDSSHCAVPVTYTPTVRGDGTHTIRGDYSGSLVHAASFDTFDLTVTLRSTRTTVSCMPDTVAVNQPTVCDAVVDDTDSGTGSAPSGTVTFSLVSDPPEAGAFSSPTCTLTPLDSDSSHCAVPVTYTPTVRGDGTHTIRGDYSGSLVHAASFDTFDLTVTLRSTRTTVSCTPGSFQAGGSTSCTATVTDTDSGTAITPTGTVAFSSNQTGTFTPPSCVLAPTPDPLDGPTAGCVTPVTYTSTVAATHTIRGDYGGDLTHDTSFDTTPVTVTPGPPAVVIVDPPTGVNEVETQHCVTARVTDAFNNPTPGVTVSFLVTVVNSAFGTRTTGADGTTPLFCYTGHLFGEDVIEAFVDNNGNRRPDPGEPTGAATKTWTLPASTAFCVVDFVTYGIRIIAANGDLGTGGGNAQVDGDGNPTGQHEYQDHGPVQPMNVHSINVLAVVCSDIDGVPGARQAQIYGRATIDGAGSHVYRIHVEDRGEPGTSDRYWIILSTGYDSESQTLIGGNVQIH